jgi:hypothetical protein
MRRGSVVSSGRAFMLVVAATLLVVWLPAAPAFGQDDVQYSAVCQNIIGSIGDITAVQSGAADAAAGQYNSEVIAEVAQEQGVSVAQVNECLNGVADNGKLPDDGKNGDDDGDVGALTKTPRGEVLTVSIPDQKVLADTGGLPLSGLALIGLGLMAAGVSLLRFGGWR